MPIANMTTDHDHESSRQRRGRGRPAGTFRPVVYGANVLEKILRENEKKKPLAAIFTTQTCRWSNLMSSPGAGKRPACCAKLLLKLSSRDA